MAKNLERIDGDWASGHQFAQDCKSDSLLLRKCKYADLQHSCECSVMKVISEDSVRQMSTKKTIMDLY